MVAARTDAIGFSPTLRAPVGTFTADGHAFGPAVTFGLDAYTWGRTILPHETQHLFGLPDLYSFATGGHPFVGMWDLMGNVFQPTDLFAWHRYHLGWLDASQFVCADPGKSTDATLTPLGAPGGIKAVFAKTSGTTAVVVENRERVGNDAAICDTGALVYTIDSSIASGLGPINVAGGTSGCGYGPASNAPLHVGETFAVAGVTVVVTGGTADALTVRVTVP